MSMPCLIRIFVIMSYVMTSIAEKKVYKHLVRVELVSDPSRQRLLEESIKKPC